MIYRYYSKVGGWRFVIMYLQSKKVIRLLDTSTFEIYVIKPDQVRELIEYTNINLADMAKRIKERKKVKKQIGVPYSIKAVRLAIEKLEERSQCLL